MAVVGHFSVFDRKANSFFPVFTAKNAEVARRTLAQSLTPNSVLVQYPQDYVLIHLCDFDDESGEIIALDVSTFAQSFEVFDLIPESLQQYALDGSFKKN